MKREFHSERSALLIIDMINSFDFKHGSILAQKTLPVAKNIMKLKKRYQKNQLPIIYINDHYNLWQADYNRIITHCRNDVSEDIIQLVTPTKEDYFLIKPKHSGFYGTALNTLLHQLDVDSLVITGIAGNICVLFTANDAYMREYAIHVPQNTIASVSDEDNAYALTMIEQVLSGSIEPM